MSEAHFHSHSPAERVASNAPQAAFKPKNALKAYRHDYARIAGLLRSICRASDEQIAAVLEIPLAQFARWQSRHSDFAAALLQAPASECDVEAALLKRALGFRQSEDYQEELVDRKSGETLEVLKRKTVTKEIPPDVRAVLFYLKNRCPERWSETNAADSKDASDADEIPEFAPDSPEAAL